MTRLNLSLFVALAASILAAADARDALPHQRMIRKRSPGAIGAHAAFALPRWESGLQGRADLLPGFGGGNSNANGNDDDNQGGSASNSATASRTSAASSSAASSTRAAATSSAQETSSSPATSSATSASVESTLSASSSSRSGLLDSLTGLLGGTQTSTTLSSTSSTPSSTVASSTSISSSSSAPAPTSQAAQTTPTPTPSLNLATPPPSSAAVKPSVAVVTSIAPEAAASSAAAANERTKKIAKNTIISLVVIASCIGGAVAIWTVIRKWKLSPSERFDDRMQPIDWAPTGGATGMREETMEEKRHRRAGSAGSHGSFTSGGVGQSELGHGTGARSLYSDHSGHNVQQQQDFPPAHDFTAGAATYGQYYQGQQQQQYGYANLQRGPSVTESTYSQGASVTRGLSYSRGGGGYEAQPGAGGVPPLPNPYGGGYEYEDNSRQQVQGQYRGY